MKLPNADRAVVEIEKLRDYCLNPVHPRGRRDSLPMPRSIEWYFSICRDTATN